METEKRIYLMAEHLPRLRPSHRGVDQRTICPRGCDKLEEEKYTKRHFLSFDKRMKMTEHFLATGKWPERRKEESGDEEHLSAERRGFKEQGVIRTFSPGDLIEIQIPFLALKHGALKEKENQILHGALRNVLPTPLNVSRYERLVTVKIGKDKTTGVPATWCHLVKAAS